MNMDAFLFFVNYTSSLTEYAIGPLALGVIPDPNALPAGLNGHDWAKPDAKPLTSTPFEKVH